MFARTTAEGKASECIPIGCDVQPLASVKAWGPARVSQRCCWERRTAKYRAVDALYELGAQARCRAGCHSGRSEKSRVHEAM